jgi:hypothetical protein
METPHNASPVRIIEEVDGIDRLEPLGAYQSQLVDLVRARLAAGVDALDVTGAVADANDSPHPTSARPRRVAPRPAADWSWFPLANPGLVAIPASFLLGYIGSITSPEHLEYKAAAMEVRSLTGAGAEGKAVEH